MAPKYYPIKAFGFETQAPRWALTLFALVLIAGIALTVYEKTYVQPEQQLLTLKDTNKQLAIEVEEYSLHAMEEPQKHELFEDQDGKLMLRVFKDHCVLIQRQTNRGMRTKLVIDLVRSGPLSSTRQTLPSFSLLPVAYAQSACQRGCLNPHPGNFKWWYGRRNGAWVEVWRQWPEGCTHVQMFQPQAGLWDSNPDGSARVRWTCCVH
jgi:hypothetical protein